MSNLNEGGAANGGRGKKYIIVLVFSAMLTALSIVLSRVCSIPIGNGYRIGFGKLPVVLAGCWMGALPGLAVGAVSDIIGAIMTTGWNPVLTIPAALTGMLPPVFLKFMAAKRGADGKTWRGFLKLLLAVLSTRVIVSGILMTFLLAYFYPTYQLKLVFFLWTRTGIAAIEAAIEAAVTYILYTNKSIDSMMKKHGI